MPFGALEESVTEWEDGRRLVVRIDSAEKLPIAGGDVTFVLRPTRDGTDVVVDYAYEPKFGLLGQIIGWIALDRQLIKGFQGFLKDLARASDGHDTRGTDRGAAGRSVKRARAGPPSPGRSPTSS